MHLQLHASEKRSTPFICDWEDCGRRFASRKLFAEHCTHHSEAALMCAYANCSIVALTPRELVHHQTQWNHQTQTLKREANVYRPQLDRLPPLPATYPAYKSVPLRISRARMRRDQHVWVGSKIAANITCYVHPGNRSNAAAPSRTSLRLAEKVADVERRAQETGMDPTQAVLHMSHGQYDSWLPYSSQRGPRYCSDLLSSYVTALVTKGLVIGAEYLAGDRRLPFEEEEEDQLEDKDNENSDIIDVDEGAQEVGNESDRTIIVDDLPRDELKGDAAADAIMANGQAPEGQADDRVRIEVLHPLSSASTPTSHGDQDKVDKDDADGAGSDVGTLSQPEWDVLRRDKEDVDGLL
ncbi:hypothetical protein BDY19DRAFT_944923 [Irpex rosettiformis]|uniref:Uncharacterized protein n=1 Tax=Irpex rosettiformis TaxID=378272 RepID=A0ACB8U4G0_9APHY|nr:hypothetical protein BDY19DRAFT_944923 [Irpex rosettiformis]